MGRKIPLCAYCGRTLYYSDRMLMVYSAMKGKPMFGWHMGSFKEKRIAGWYKDERQCYENDVIKVGEDHVTNPTHDPLKIIAEIEKRGSGRVLLTNKPKGAK